MYNGPGIGGVHVHAVVCRVVCACMCVRTYLPVHAPTYVPSRACAYVRTFPCMYVRMYLPVHLRTYVPSPACAYVCTFPYMYVHMYLPHSESSFRVVIPSHYSESSSPDIVSVHFRHQRGASESSALTEEGDRQESERRAETEER